MFLDHATIRSIFLLVFCRKAALKIYGKFTGKHPWRREKLHCLSLQIYWNKTSPWLLSCEFYEYFQKFFFTEQYWTITSERLTVMQSAHKLHIHAFFIKLRIQCFIPSQPQCCLTSSWIELQMLLRCCLIHITIILLRQFLYLLYLCPCLDLGSFMSYLCDLFFIFIFIIIMIIIYSYKYKRTCSFAYFLKYFLIFFDDNEDEICE